MESEPDFESYSRQELLEIYLVIDRQAYPERFHKVKSLLGFDEQEREHEGIGQYDDDHPYIDPQLRQINKANRIKEYFDSLAENDSSLMSSDYGNCDGGGTGDIGSD